MSSHPKSLPHNVRVRSDMLGIEHTCRRPVNVVGHALNSGQSAAPLCIFDDRWERPFEQRRGWTCLAERIRWTTTSSPSGMSTRVASTLHNEPACRLSKAVQVLADRRAFGSSGPTRITPSRPPGCRPRCLSEQYFRTYSSGPVTELPPSRSPGLLFHTRLALCSRRIREGHLPL